MNFSMDCLNSRVGERGNGMGILSPNEGPRGTPTPAPRLPLFEATRGILHYRLTLRPRGRGGHEKEGVCVCSYIAWGQKKKKNQGAWPLATFRTNSHMRRIARRCLCQTAGRKAQDRRARLPPLIPIQKGRRKTKREVDGGSEGARSSRLEEAPEEGRTLNALEEGKEFT